MTDARAIPNFSLDPDAKKRLLDRFLSYAKVHTQSSEESKSHPTTECQWDLLNQLKAEVEGMGLEGVFLEEHGYLYASFPANREALKEAPPLGLVAHVDTYPAVSGKGVNPQIIESYAGGDIILPGDPAVAIRIADNPNLDRCLGHTLITSDGTTLLGADDKAGIALILTVVEWLQKHPEVPHGPIRIAFTTDEETGRGTEFFDVKRFGAEVAYTIDGSNLGEIEDETFCGDGATVTFTGADCHPGWGKGKLKSAIRAAADLVSRLPEDSLPETTEGRQPYLHPYMISGDVSKVVITFILRAFTEHELEDRGRLLRALAEETRGRFPDVACDVAITRSYRNMKAILDKRPQVMDLALEAVRRAGLEPVRHSIRGGTDGANLSFMGVPTPNIFAGGQSFHSLREWVSLEWMSKSAETILHLVDLWSREKRTAPEPAV